MDMNIVPVWLHIIAIVIFTSVCVTMDPLTAPKPENT